MEDQREQQEQKFREMTQAPVGRLVGRLAFPCIISMLVTAFYNMADTFFVGMMDSNAATGAVGVVFSMMAIIPATAAATSSPGNWASTTWRRPPTWPPPAFSPPWPPGP